MMKVYVVYAYECFECCPPEAAFSSREKAMEYVNFDPDLLISELEVDVE